ncbi:MAG: C40 family peptidase [Paludibacter sp.]|nr:C40 family peptidase [Paludibacter sp.]
MEFYTVRSRFLRTKQVYFKLYRLLIILLPFIILYSCSSTRVLEKRQVKEAYDALGITKNHKDNIVLYKEAALWLHVPHVEGGCSYTGVDCSCLVRSIYKKVYGKFLERSSAAIMEQNCRKIRKSRLREGDLVFFNTSSKRTKGINHVGIYLKEDKFLHASSSRGVIVSSLNEPYYQRTWVCAGRVR